MFASADSGDRHRATIKLIQTAKLNEIDPLSWPTDVLTRIVGEYTERSTLDQLLTWNGKAAKAAEAHKNA